MLVGWRFCMVLLQLLRPCFPLARQYIASATGVTPPLLRTSSSEVAVPLGEVYKSQRSKLESCIDRCNIEGGRQEACEGPSKNSSLQVFRLYEPWDLAQESTNCADSEQDLVKNYIIWKAWLSREKVPVAVGLLGVIQLCPIESDNVPQMFRQMHQQNLMKRHRERHKKHNKQQHDKQRKKYKTQIFRISCELIRSHQQLPNRYHAQDGLIASPHKPTLLYLDLAKRALCNEMSSLLAEQKGHAFLWKQLLERFAEGFNCFNRFNAFPSNFYFVDSMTPWKL